jgi:asparagine synthase (glutamine-hydrolysing)
MCGIYGLINYKQKKHGSIKNLESMFIKGSKRGPETSNFNKVICDENEILLGFHRLAINGYNKPTSEQPIKKDSCILICNGEIYNWKHLNKLSNSNCNTGSDCEIIIDLYKKYGPQQTLNMLDGVYAFILIDFEKESVFIARDTYGVRPLFKWELKNGSFLFASEIKMGFKTDIDIRPEPFAPGSYIYSSLKDKYDFSNIIFSQPNSFINSSLDDVVNIRYMIRKTLMTAVEKRVDNTDRDIACLLSGGLDSSLITAMVVNIYNNLGKGKKIHTWSIGMDGSEDLKYARLVADYLKTEHHEIKLKEDDFINAIPEVIYTIESNDITSIRASVGNYLICKYIKEQSDAKVVFNGDGSDEVTGGYLYFHCAPDSIEFDKECRRLLKDIHLFDVLRSDRTISCHGLEARTPFLDRNFVQTYLSIPCQFRNHNYGEKQCEKYLLRSSFSDMNLLPHEVLWRTKEAFSDGVSKLTKSWFEIIQDYASKKYNINDKKLAEKHYYDTIFSEYFGEISYNKKIIPYKWMPKFIEADDASARTLKIYNNLQS